VLAFSRILLLDEVLIAANTDPAQSRDLDVIVDFGPNPAGTKRRVAYSNKAAPHRHRPVREIGTVKAAPTPPSPVREIGTVIVNETDGSTSHGPIHVVRVTLNPMEVQILAR